MEQRHAWNKIELMLINLAAQINQANFFTPTLKSIYFFVQYGKIVYQIMTMKFSPPLSSISLHCVDTFQM